MIALGSYLSICHIPLDVQINLGSITKIHSSLTSFITDIHFFLSVITQLISLVCFQRRINLSAIAQYMFGQARTRSMQENSTKKKTRNTMLRLPFSNGKLYNYTYPVNGKKVSMSPQNAINKQHLRTFRLIKGLSNHYIIGVKPISCNQV